MKKWENFDELGSVYTFKFLKVLLIIIPYPLLVLFAFPVSFFYYILAKDARKAVVNYKKRIEAVTGKKLNTWKLFLSFAITIVEKGESWAGKIKFKHLHFHNDDSRKLNSLLKEGKGLFAIVSHLGSAETLRALSDNIANECLNQQLKTLSIVDFKGTDKFNTMISKINPNAMINLLSIFDITLNSIDKLEDTLNSGGLIIIAGDRTGERNYSIPFLGKEASFPFGSFYLPTLFESTTMFVCCVRTKLISFKRSYEVYVQENSNVLLGDSKKKREQFAKSTCTSYVAWLETFVIKYPYQWYNFYDFWSEENDCSRKRI